MKFNGWEQDLKNVVRFWIIWNDYKKNKQGKYRDLTSFFDSSISFEDALNKIYEKCYGQLDMFSSDIDFKIEKKVDEIFQAIKKEDITAITYDHFKDVPALSHVKDSHFFFLKGDLRILDKNQDDFVSVVGSRKTPITYKNWIDKVVPKKVIVSGLANGADVIAHEWAIEKNLQIIVFPGIDIYKKPVRESVKKKIWDYAEKNGVIISDIFPKSDMFDDSVFLKRNKWMAQMVIETYATYFEGLSGTLGQLLEVSRRGGKVILPTDVLAKNHEFLKNHKAFSEILEKVEAK